MEQSQRKGNKKKTALQYRVNVLDQLLAEKPDSELHKERKLLENELDEFVCEKTFGAHIRSREQWEEEGKHSTKYFLNLENLRLTHNVIEEVQKKVVVY